MILFDIVTVIERTTFQHIMNIYIRSAPVKNGSGVYLIHNCYNMVSFCPDGYPNTLPFYGKCQSGYSDLLSRVPISTAKTIYRNIYCAMCNGLDVQREAFFPWEMEYICDKNPDINQTITLPNDNTTNQYRCHYVYKPPSSGVALPSFHCHDYIEKCNSSFGRQSWLARACSSYFSRIQIGKKGFKNTHCAMCNSGQVFERMIACTSSYFTKKPTVESTDGYAVSLPDFSKLIEFIKSSPRKDEGKEITKAFGLIYNKRADTNLTDLPQLLDGADAAFSIFLRIYGENKTNLTSIMDIIPYVERIIAPSIVYTIDEGCKGMSGPESVKTENDWRTPIYICIVFKPRANTSFLNFGINEVTNSLISIIQKLCLLVDCSDIVTFTVLNYVGLSFDSRCQVGSPITYDVSGDINQILSREEIRINSTNHTYSIMSVPLLYTGVAKYSHQKFTINTQNMSVTICEYILNNCSKRSFPKSAYETFGNGTIFVPQYNLYLSNAMFEYYDEGIIVCSSIFENSKTVITGFGIPIKSIVSLICNSISLFSLFCTFIVYCMFPSLRTLAGKSVMNLVVAMFLGQLIFQLSALPIAYKIPCLVVAVMQHYFFLATFAWMSVIGYDMYSTFKSPTLSGLEDRSDKLYIYYVLIAWISPLVVVGPCLVLHFSGDGTFGYGGHLFCWLTNSMSIIIFFGIPLAISLLLNILFFARTAFVIFVAAKATQMVRKGNSLELIVVIKMASLMGFTWLFSMLSGLLLNDVLDYMFIVFSGLQGFYLFLAFVAKKSTLNLFRLKFTDDVNTSIGTQSSSLNLSNLK